MSNDSNVNAWFLIPRPRKEPKLRLFCFPYAGGGAHTYLTWPAYMDEEVEVCSIQLPGREMRILEKPIRSMPALVELLREAIYPYCNIPFAFFGHSMGALIAFELAHSLVKEKSISPFHLFVSGHEAPWIKQSEEIIHALPYDLFIEKIRELKGTPPEIFQTKELLNLLLPMLRADFELCETYTYGHHEKLSIPITVYGGRFDHKVCKEDLYGWEKETSGAFEVNMFSGGHFFLNNFKIPLLINISTKLNLFLNDKVKYCSGHEKKFPH